jgi:hypothetical protein
MQIPAKADDSLENQRNIWVRRRFRTAKNMLQRRIINQLASSSSRNVIVSTRDSAKSILQPIHDCGKTRRKKHNCALLAPQPVDSLQHGR